MQIQFIQVFFITAVVSLLTGRMDLGTWNEAVLGEMECLICLICPVIPECGVLHHGDWGAKRGKILTHQCPAEAASQEGYFLCAFLSLCMAWRGSASAPRGHRMPRHGCLGQQALGWTGLEGV